MYQKIRAGSYYYDEIENAVSSSKVFLFVQTKNSVESKEIPDEVLTTIDEGKTIISFIVEESDLHGQMKLKLKHRQHMDATIPEFDDRIRDFAMELYVLLGRTLDDEYCPVADEAVKEKLISTPSVIPKSVFCGREDVIKEIAQKFDDGELSLLKELAALERRKLLSNMLSVIEATTTLSFLLHMQTVY